MRKKVYSTNRYTLVENCKRVAPGNKKQIFWKTVSVAASAHTIFQVLDPWNIYNMYFGDDSVAASDVKPKEKIITTLLRK